MSKKIDNLHGIDPVFQKKALEKIGIFTEEQLDEAYKNASLNISLFVTPTSELLKLPENAHLRAGYEEMIQKQNHEEKK
ncbi:hypothetical protein [Acetobacterium bakii]|uniref:Uncharacterized protein n=1 Tax=Acetobacterium bakii TaxID=52689 RepID=A0A0L6TYX5_9FIRM|nr:hypothetical protein [Acetobacterium bakii]KNZ41466.1 hypothetical protein AKG39_11920 [Acetobacterium bakii]